MNEITEELHISKEVAVKFQILLLLLYIELIISIYINFRILVIICFTFKKEIKMSYYPTLLCMEFLIFFSNIALVFNVIFRPLFWASSGRFDSPILVFPCVFSLVTPTLVSLLDLLLCVHRLLAYFGSFERKSYCFRWFGPIIFFLMSPFIIYVAFYSLLYTFFNRYSNKTRALFYMFIVDNSIKFIFGLVSISGYLLILISLKRSTKRCKHLREESSVLRQALPIASFQLFSTLVQISLQLPSNSKALGNPELLTLDYVLSCACSIVVPLSIIFASWQKREMFLKSFCNWRLPTPTRSPVRLDSKTATNYQTTRF